LVLMLSKKDVETVLTMKESIVAVEEAFRELASGTALMPTRVALSVSDKKGWMGAMPAYLSGAGALAAKIVTAYENNPSKHKLPTVMALIVLNDPETGKTKAVLEGTHITAMRTGAASGVAAKYLARQDSRVVGVFGAGTQARTQLEAIKQVRNVQSALIYDIIPERAKRFSEEMGRKLGIEVRAEASPERITGMCDIIATASTSRTPVFDGGALKKGVHVNAVGSYTPDARELDDLTIVRSKLVVDSRQAALQEAGDIIIPLKAGMIAQDHIYAELGEIVAGLKPARENDDEVTVFKSVGLGIQDAAVANFAYKKAREKGIGQEIEFL